MEKEKKEPADSSETKNVQDQYGLSTKVFFVMVYLTPYFFASFFTYMATRHVLGGDGGFNAGMAVFWILAVLGRTHRDAYAKKLNRQ